jgi:hypothetical protein
MSADELLLRAEIASIEISRALQEVEHSEGMEIPRELLRRAHGNVDVVIRWLVTVKGAVSVTESDTGDA